MNHEKIKMKYGHLNINVNLIYFIYSFISISQYFEDYEYISGFCFVLFFANPVYRHVLIHGVDSMTNRQIFFGVLLKGWYLLFFFFRETFPIFRCMIRLLIELFDTGLLSIYMVITNNLPTFEFI